MADCEDYLWQQVKSVEPTQTQKDGAKRSQNHLRDILCSGNMASRIKSHYLSGSYARNTAVYPLDDVDIIFVIEPKYWPHSSNFFFGSDRFPKSTAVLDSFAKAIRYRYAVSSVFGQRRSVRLQLYHLDIDVVPAIQSPNDANFIYIPDKEMNEWILSSPLVHKKKATMVNKYQGGRLKPLVKLLKYWNGNLPSTARFKSFAIETICVRIFEHVPMITLQEGLCYFFDFVASFSSHQNVYKWTKRYGISLHRIFATVPDAANSGGNIIARLDNERRRRFIESAIRSRSKIVEACTTASSERACRRVAEALHMN